MSHQNILEDLLSVGGDVLARLVEARHELKSCAKSHAENVTRKLDLVTRDEFDAAFAMLAKARNAQEDLAERLARIESLLNLSSDKKTVKTKKRNLPSVKTRKKRRTAK